MINHGFDPTQMQQQYHEFFVSHVRAVWPHWPGADRCHFVGEHTVLPLVYSAGLDDQQLEWLRSIQNPIICVCTNPFPTQQLAAKLQQILGPDQFFLLDWDASAQPAYNTAYWPFFLIEQRCRPRSILHPRQYRISMLAGQVRPHRLRLWQAVRDLIREDDVIVLNSFGRQNVVPGDPVWQNLALEDLPWSNHVEFLDSTDCINAVEDTASTQHPAFRACVNITAESLGSNPGIFVTEKTWKAIEAGCMNWHWPGSALGPYLESMGFHTWFSHDADAEIEGRLLFARDDIWQFYHDHAREIQQDIELFWDLDLARSLSQPALTQLDSWLAR